MSEFTMPTPPSDDEFDSFLTEAENDKPLDFDTKTYLEGLNRRVEDALHAVGYTPLLEDNERSHDVHDMLVKQLHEVRSEAGEVNFDESIPEQAFSAQKIMRFNEVIALEKIRLLTVSLEIDEM